MAEEFAHLTIEEEVEATTTRVETEHLRRYLVETCLPNTVRYIEDGVHALVLDGRGFAVEGRNLDEAVEDMIFALREYADDWGDRLSSAPNHQHNWPVAVLTSISTDAQLREWLLQS